MAAIVFISYDETRVRCGFFFFFFNFEEKQSRIRKMLTKNVYKEYMAINFRICTNVFIGHTAHCRKWAKNLLHAVLFFSWAANERNCFFF